MKDADRKTVWLVEALYMLGLSPGEIGNGKFLKAIGIVMDEKLGARLAAKIVRSEGLQVIRSGPERWKKMALLNASAPAGMERFIPRASAKLAAQASAKLRSGVSDARLREEMMLRRSMPSRLASADAARRQASGELHHAFSVVVSDRKSTVRVNSTITPIEYLYRHSKIPQFAYEAANMLLRDWLRSEIGGLASFDPTKDIVDVSASSVGLSDQKLDALDRVRRVFVALDNGYSDQAGKKRMRAAVWFYVIEQKPGRVWVGRIRKPIVPVLIKGLEHVAWVYRMAPSGEISRHLDATFQRIRDERSRG